MLRDLHRELLREARDKNENKEVAYVLSNDFQRRQTVYGSGSEIEFSYAPFGKNQFLLHNHPRNHNFSMTDIVTFLREDNLSVMTIVKNNGDVELLTKGENYDKVKTAQELDRRRKKIKQKTDSNYDKMIIRFLTDMNEKDKIIWMKK